MTITVDDFFDNYNFRILRSQYDIEMHVADARIFVFRLRDIQSRQIVDLTGAQLIFTVVHSLTNPFYEDETILEKHSATHPTELFVEDAANGIVVLKVTKLDTVGLLPREYDYALSFTTPAGDSHTILAGHLKLRRAVSRLAGKSFYHKEQWVGLPEVDGVRTDFDLEALPEANSTIVIFDGVIQTEGVDYIIDQRTLIFTTGAPLSGGTVEIIYPSIEP